MEKICKVCKRKFNTVDEDVNVCLKCEEDMVDDDTTMDEEEEML